MVLLSSLAFPGSGVFSVSVISVPMAVARFLASLHSVVLLPVGLWVSQVHQVISGSMELGRGGPLRGIYSWDPWCLSP